MVRWCVRHGATNGMCLTLRTVFQTEGHSMTLARTQGRILGRQQDHDSQFVGDVKDALRGCDGLTYAIERINGLRDNGRSERNRPAEVQGGSGDTDRDVSGAQLVGNDQRRDADYEIPESIAERWDGSPSTAF